MSCYNDVNEHRRDSEIEFVEQEHIYLVGGEKLCSVSEVVKRYFKEFDAQYWSQRKAQELGVSPQELIDQWRAKGEESSLLGTQLHSQIETFFLTGQSIPSDDFKLFEAFVTQNKLIPFRSEWRVFDVDYKLAGTVDFISCVDGVYKMYDWKRSAKIVDKNGKPIDVNRFQWGLNGMSHICDTPFNHYCLQQNLYKFLIEKNYGIIIDEMNLVVLHPNYCNYHLVKVPVMRDEIEIILQDIDNS